MQIKNGHIEIAGRAVSVFSEKDPSQLPWDKLDIDIAFECTGFFKVKEECQKHIEAGAKSVFLSAPAKSSDIPLVVYGVNAVEDTKIISCAGCTTNCIAPVLEIMGRRIGIEKATMTTIHAYTSTQNLVDGPNKRVRRGRAGACNFVPTSTGAAKATVKVLPEYAGKFDGLAIRGPVACGSMVDLVFVTSKKTTVEEVNRVFKEEAKEQRYYGILGVTQIPFVSSDIIKDARASVVDLAMTQVIDGDLVKVMSWYDNEWGYASQMIKEAVKV